MEKNLIHTVLTTLLLLLLSINNLHSQSVGLVLSGGGAKGLYHIGIIKALEENDIPIDYIAGTSMGAIVAGMYASGMTTEEMMTIFRSKDVETWLSGKMEDKYRFYFKEQSPTGTMVSMDVDIRKFLDRRENSDETLLQVSGANNSPMQSNNIKAAIPSTQLDIAMLDYFSPSSEAAHHNFDSLFVPFRCVSVNIIDREEYLWREGDLSLAIRSSMSIPLVFKPVVKDGMMMVDGGVMNNFPWRDMQTDFNPDIMIGGICTKSSTDPSTIMGQIELIAMNKTDYDLPDSLGVKIERDVDVPMLDYSRVDYVVNLGYNDAIRMMPQIKERIERRVSKSELNARRLKFKHKSPELVIDQLSINGLNPEQAKFIEEQIDFKQKENISYDDFKREYFKVLEGGILTADMPSASYNSATGNYAVSVDMAARPTLRAMSGVNISSSNINAGFLGFEYSKLGKISTIHSLSGYLGNFYSMAAYDTRFNFYDRKTPYYVKANAVYEFYDYGRGNNQRYSFSNRAFDYSRLNSTYLSAAIGTPVGRTSKIELRAAIGSDIYKYDINSLGSELIVPNSNRFKYATANISLSRNSLNYKAYPTAGLRQSISAMGSLMGEHYTQGRSIDATEQPTIKEKLNWVGVSYSRDDYYSLSKYFTFGYALEMAYTTIPDAATSYANALIAPGYYPTEHSNTLFIPQYHNRSYVSGGIKPIFKWNDKLYLKTEAFAYYSNFETGKNSDLLFIASSSLVYQSPLGPVSFNYSHYDNSTVAENYFTLNIGFIIFKQRGIKFF